MSVQGVQNWGPHFQFMRFGEAPIFSLCALKNFYDFIYDCIFIIMTTQ